MQPLTALLAIVAGSAVALALGLAMTFTVILFLPAQEALFAPERGALLKAIAVFTLFAIACSASFYGELRLRPWRYSAHAAMLAMFAVAVWIYWPQ
jgi:hypothetical protein